jgi:hypothetical protein
MFLSHDGICLQVYMALQHTRPTSQETTVPATSITSHRSCKLTLLDIMIVNKALLFELMATFRVVAWNSTNTLCKTEVTVKV